jgi:hypothetical protein
MGIFFSSRCSRGGEPYHRRGRDEDSSVALKQHVDNPGQTPMTVGNP